MDIELLNGAAKKAAWGNVQVAAAVSIKDQEVEAEKARSQGRAPPQQRVLNSEGAPKPMQSEKPFGSSGGVASSAWASRRQESDYSRPSERDYRDRGDRGGDYDRERPERKERPEVPFPTEAPFVLYLSGLPYEGTEGDVLRLLPDFLGEELHSRIKNVKVPIKDGRLRHAFIEFEDAEALREALTFSGREFMGRKVACLVADPPREEARWGHAPGSGFSGFGRRDNNGGGSWGGDRGDRMDRGGMRRGFQDSAPRKPLNLAPRSSDSASSTSTPSDKPRYDPFGGATASTRDIYADKPKPAPAPVSSSGPSSAGPRAPAKPHQQEEPSRADRSDWKSKDASSKGPRFTSFGGRGGDDRPPRESRDSGFRGGSRGGASSGSHSGSKHASNADEGEWRSTGGKPQQARQPKAASPSVAPASANTNASSGDGGNRFDLLGDE